MVELKRIYWTRQALKLAYLAVTVWLFASAIGALMPNKVVTGEGDGVSAVTGMLREMFDRVVGAVAVPGMFLLTLTIVAVIIRTQDLRRREPGRRFSRQQRREGMTRSAGRCEMEAGFRRRCSRPAQHGDHFYPWSKGGSANLQNLVAAYARGNRTKEARISSPGQRHRIERRRREYVASDGPVRVGERQPLR
jgi:hypothetical protein